MKENFRKLPGITIKNRKMQGCGIEFVCGINITSALYE